MRWERMAPGLVALAMAAALGACGGLPTVSTVQQGSQVGEPAVLPVRVQPEAPSTGAPPDQIVRGFLRAGAGDGFDNDHAVARSFFTSSVKDEWLPDSGVEVFGDDAPLKIELLNPTTVQVTASLVAQIDSVGHYHETAPGTLAKATFGMEKLAAGWRISAPQKGFGLWLSVSDLARIYRPFTIAYVSMTSHSIVGDRRWFPITSGLATTLARAQLAPVPGYLVGAARTGIPAGTSLAVDAVPVESGRAVVDLSSSALSAGPDLRRAMWAQFVTTLMQVPSVGQVSLEVQGAGLDLPGTPDGVSAVKTLGYEPDPSVSARPAILRTGAELSRVSSDQPLNKDAPGPVSEPATGLALAKIGAQWVCLALSTDSREIAGVQADHGDLARWQGSRMFQLAKFGSSLTKPSYDSLDGLWVAGQDRGATSVWVIDTSLNPMANAKPRAISAPWLSKRTVLALRVASDNQRVALISTDPAGGDVRVEVAGVVRSAQGVAVALTAEALRVGWTITSATDLAWVDDSTLAVLGAVGPQGGLGPQLVQIGGQVAGLSPVAGARLVTNAGGPRGVVVVTDQGKVMARAGNGWQQLQTGSDFLIPGE